MKNLDRLGPSGFTLIELLIVGGFLSTLALAGIGIGIAAYLILN